MKIKDVYLELNRMLGLRDKTLAEACVRATIQIIKDEISKRGEVKLEGFGTFFAKPFKRKKSYNYKTKEFFTPDVTFSPSFKPIKTWHLEMKKAHRIPLEQYLEEEAKSKKESDNVSE